MEDEVKSLFNPSERFARETRRFDCTAQEYLDEHDVRKYLQDCLSLLCELKQTPPLQFLAAYFNAAATGSNVLFRQFKYVNCTPHNRRCFVQQFKQIFRGFNAKEVMKPEAFHQLLCLLCPDFPFSLVRNASRITIDAVEPSVEVQFGEFSRKLFILFFFSECMNQAALAFRTIDNKATGRVAGRLFLEYLTKILVAKSSLFSCPSLAVVESVLLSIDSGSKEEDGVMFNAFCVSLFNHPEVESALRAPPSYAQLKQNGKLLEIAKKKGDGKDRDRGDHVHDR